MLSQISTLSASALILSSFVSASPVDKRVTTSYTAKYDDLSQLPVAQVPIGTYEGLTYSNIDVATLGVAGSVITGVVPKSAPNTAVYALNTMLGGTPTVAAQTGQTFDLSNFYFGCVLTTEESATGAATACTVTVTATGKDGSVTAKSFTFNPGAISLRANMVQANVNLKKLTKVTFATSNLNAALTTATATLFDNFSYTINS